MRSSGSLSGGLVASAYTHCCVPARLYGDTMATKTFLTTDSIPESNRLDFWRECICKTFIHHECLPTSVRPFFGEIATFQIQDYSFSRLRTREHRTIRTPSHVRQTRDEAVLLTLQLSGTCSLIFQDNQEIKLQSGDVVCYDSTQPYSAIVDEEIELLVLHLAKEVWMRRIGPTENMTNRALRGVTSMGALVSTFLRQAVSVAESAEPATAHRLIEVSLDLVTMAFGELVRGEGSVRQSAGRVALLLRAKALIKENLHAPELKPEKIASGMGISLRYLYDLFKEENTTVSRWIWEKRLEKSRRDLSDPLLASKNISQIAFACGFNDFSHFCRRFRTAYSISASEFRNKHLTKRQALHQALAG